MNKTELIKYLQENNRSFLPEDIYIFDKKNLDYKLTISESIFYNIHFDAMKSVIPGDIMGYKLEIYITLFNLDIDNEFKKVSKRYKQLKLERQPLLTTDVGTLMANPNYEKVIINNPYYIEVYSEKDFGKQHDKFKMVFEKYVFPFIERFKSLQEQYVALQFDPMKRNIYGMWRAENIMKSIILGKIMNQTDWPLLFAKYEPLFQEVFNKDSRDEFYELRQLMLGH